MDETMLRRHLARAERHVAEGEVHLARQRELIRKLERDGHGSRAARRFLRSLEETQALHVADRDRVRAELRRACKTLRTSRSPAVAMMRPSR